MKIKITKSWLGMFLIFLTVGSTASFSLLQFVKNPQPRIILPAENIIDYQLTPEQEDFAIESGKTLIIFWFNETCTGCVEIRDFLKDFIEKYKEGKQQIILSIIYSNVTDAKLRIKSWYHVSGKLLINPSLNQTFDALCDFMVSPPLSCALR